MPNPIIAPGRFKVTYIVGQDASNATRTLGSASATIDNYTAAYVVKFPDAVSFAVVPKSTPAAGVTTTVNVTVHATDANGAALPATVQSFDIQGPPAPPVATKIIVSGISDLAVGTEPADPGTPTTVLL